MMWLDELLDALKASFVSSFRSIFDTVPLGVNKFDFERDLEAIIARHERDAEARKNKTQKAFDDTKLANDIRTIEQKKDAEAARAEKDKAKAAKEDAEGNLSPSGKVKRVQKGFVPKAKKGGGEAGASPASGKKKRDWDPLSSGGGGGEGADDLDRSTDRPSDGAIYLDEAETKALMGDGTANVDDWEVDSEDEEAEQKGGGSKKKGIFSYLSNLTGTRELTAEDLAPVLTDFKELLVGKNVAMHIAEKLCQSVGEGLEGRKISGYNGVKKAVRGALEEALARILTPKQVSRGTLNPLLEFEALYDCFCLLQEKMKRGRRCTVA
jgi:signal recognition particle receptor subunit alpha